MAAPSYTYSLTNGTTADASQVMQNYNDILNGVTDGTKDLTINALTMNGALNCKGNTTLGDATADDVTITGSLASTINIKTTNTYNIGSATLGLAGAYFGTASTQTARIVAASLASSRTYTLPDAGAAADFVMTAGGQNIAGTKSFTGIVALADGTVSAPGIAFTSSTNTGIYSPATNQFAIATSGTQRLFIDSSGTASSVRFYAPDGTNLLPAYSFTSDTNTGMYSTGADSIGWAVGGASAMTVSSAGQFTVGPTDISAPIIVAKNACATASSARRVVDAQYTVDTDCTGGYFFTALNSSGTVIGRCEAATNTTTSWTGSSDARLKRDPKDFSGLALLAKIVPRNFEWKSNPGSRSHGFYAQELHQVLPEAVSVGTDDVTEDGSLALPWGVDYSKLTPVLVKALQETVKRIEALEAGN